MFSDVKVSELFQPIGALSVGRFFSPSLGVRLNGQGWMSKGGYKVNNEVRDYTFNYVTGSFDLLFNLSNLISSERVHPLNVMLVGGLGLAYAWDDEEMIDTRRTYGITGPTTWKDNLLTRNLRLGAQVEYNIAKHWGINLEVLMNNMGDKFNGKLNNSSDWQASALLGVTYKFGFQKKKQSDISALMANQEYVNSRNTGVAVAGDQTLKGEKPVAKVEEKPAAPVQVVEEVKKEVKKETSVFFEIRSAEISAAEEVKVKELAEWLKEHPKAKVTLTAYADAATGTAKFNLSVSKKRAEAVKNLLVKKYKVDASRVKAEGKGATVQPFAENDKNRVAIAVAQE